MSQNRSSAVMQQRSEPHDSLDDFPTPPWATRALCEWLQDEGHHLHNKTCREPCANRGHMVRPLKEYFAEVEASDVHDYGAGFPVQDYLFGPDPEMVDWTFFNPPFRLAQEFVERALRTSRRGVAMLVRSAFLEGQDRYFDLFSDRPPAHILQFSERVIMHKGVLRDPAVGYFDEVSGTWKKPSTATAYCWLVWIGQLPDPLSRTSFGWIAPCRKQLERADDYPAIQQ